MASSTTPIGLALKSKKDSICFIPLIEPFKTPNKLKSVTLKNLKAFKIRQNCREFSKNMRRTNAESLELQKAYSLNDEAMNSSITGFCRAENLLGEVKTQKTLTDKHAKILEVCESGAKSYPVCCEFLSALMGVLKGVFDNTEQTIINFQERIKSIEEDKQTLKILKKRFQKLAFENLELNESLSNKEKKIFRLNEKIKNLRTKKIKLDDNASVTEFNYEMIKSDDQLELFEYKNESINAEIFESKQFAKNKEKVEVLAAPKKKFLRVLDNNNLFFSMKSGKFPGLSGKSAIVASKSSKGNSFAHDFEFIF